MAKIEAVIFDWAGTLVDYGCMAAIETYREIFDKYHIKLSTEEIRRGMGQDKVDHIRDILESERIAKLWFERTGMEPNEGDVSELNRCFQKTIIEKFPYHSEPKEHVKNTIMNLREQGIKIGSTTSYTKEMMDVLVPIAKEKKLEVDVVINSEDIRGQGRPNPFMIFKNMEKLGINSVKSVVKIGDTVNDIKEGVNAGVYSIGVTDGSSEMGLSYEEFEAVSEEEKEQKRRIVTERFKKAGAYYVIHNMKSLLYVINAIQNNKTMPAI
ncbi:MAG: phosphonoacetaldehyde hydrolase [Lachnospirales bacterium]